LIAAIVDPARDESPHQANVIVAFPPDVEPPPDPQAAVAAASNAAIPARAARVLKRFGFPGNGHRLLSQPRLRV
jgi:hypothetical protein